MSREDIEEAIEVLEDASAEMLTETGDENYYVEAIAILRQALSGEAVKHIKTWNERCEEHPDHQERIISERMIQERMQEEIDELRQALETEQKTAVSPGEGTGFNYFRASAITVLRQPQEPVCAHGVEKTKCDFCQSKQEPVAWISEGGDVSRSKRYMDEMGFKCNPLYTAPPKQWVGLTDEDYKELSKIAFVEVIEKIERVLKEKNA